ncbi:uncharacterized protein LOC117102564 [Anneissia japonica]|uniref:uncharacterized protein LOC117102564 n=1 Tax=Anneissia japonica TaxID=1529436 RepID=UPI0014254E16|nr:uncharacterized protein LOC117102564 [Anneissia japonica]
MTMTSMEVFVIILSTVICRFEGLEITQHPRSQYVSKGDNVTFTCGFSSSFGEYDGYRRIWSRKLEGEAIPTMLTDELYVNPLIPGRFAVSQDELFNYELSIAPVLYNDAGTYYCEVGNVATNTLLSRSDEAQLEVYTPAQDPLCYIQRVINNTQYVCTSNIEGDTIYWVYENKLILQQVIKVVENDTRTLQCYVNNSFGVPSRTCIINNNCVVRHESDGLVVIGDNAAFTCSCRYQHLSNFTSWTYNGSTISSSKERFLVRDKSLFINGILEKDNGLLIRCNANNKTNEVSSGWLKLQTLSKTSTTQNIDPSATVTPIDDSVSYETLKYITLVLIIIVCVITVGGMGSCCIRCRKKNKLVISNHRPPMAPDSTQLPTIATPIHFSQNKHKSESTTYENFDIKRNVFNDSEDLPVYDNIIKVTNVVYDNLRTDTSGNRFENDYLIPTIGLGECYPLHYSNISINKSHI